MEREGEDRERCEAQTDRERTVAQLLLKVERHQRDERSEDEIEAEDRRISRSRRRPPGVREETPPRHPSRSRLRRFRDRNRDDEADQQARREDVEQGGVAEAGHDRTGGAESNPDRGGQRPARQPPGAATPP